MLLYSEIAFQIVRMDEMKMYYQRNIKIDL